MSRNRLARWLTVPLVALSAFLLQPGAVARAGLDDTSNPGCPAVTALPAVVGRVIDFTGSISCYRPGGSTKFGLNIAPDPVQVREAQPQLGDPCQNFVFHPVSFTEDVNGDPAGHFALFGNATEGSHALTGTDPDKMGTFDAFVADTQLGSYELSNPNDPNSALQCVLNPTFHFFCPTNFSAPTVGALDQFCFAWKPHGIAAPPPAPQDVAPFFADRIGQLQARAGEIQSAPAVKGVVNTTTCFWIENVGIPAEQDMTLILPGPIDSSGRQIFYTYFAKLQFQGLQWHFGDGDDTQTLATPRECAGHQFLGLHQYTRISDEQPGGKYQVTVTEQYSLSVTVNWIDSNGFHGPFSVDTGQQPTLTPGSYLQYVGQVEGVPIGGQ